jgi:hypothetical protein
MTERTTTYNALELFSKNTNFYGDVNQLGKYDYYFLTFLSKFAGSNSNLLDIGGGSGKFASLTKNNIPDMDVTVVDPCQPLLNMIKNPQIKVVCGELPQSLNLDNCGSFKFIHIKEVLHHIVGATIKDSKELCKTSLMKVNEMLDEDGYLLIHEIFYEGHITSLPRTLIFYLCEFQRKTKIKIPGDEFLEGLSVCFYARSEFRSMLNDCGFEIVQYNESNWKKSYKTTLLGIKRYGRMIFILKKRASNNH